MDKVICENCVREYEPPSSEDNDVLDNWDLKDLAEFDGWKTSGLFVFCPDCKGSDKDVKDG